jgi:hypothetical protein
LGIDYRKAPDSNTLFDQRLTASLRPSSRTCRASSVGPVDSDVSVDASTNRRIDDDRFAGQRFFLMCAMRRARVVLLGVREQRTTIVQGTGRGRWRVHRHCVPHGSGVRPWVTIGATMSVRFLKLSNSFIIVLILIALLLIAMSVSFTVVAHSLHLPPAVAAAPQHRPRSADFWTRLDRRGPDVVLRHEETILGPG